MRRLPFLLFICFVSACGESLPSRSPVLLDNIPGPDASIELDGGDVASCPAQVNIGSALGEVPPEVTLMDCDGNSYQLRDLCDQPAWLFLYAHWCPPCRAKAEGVQARQTHYAAQGLNSWFVITENGQGGPPNETLCSGIRQQYGLQGPVLIDSSGALQNAFQVPSNDVNIILDAQQRIQAKTRYASPSEVNQLIEAVLN